MFLTKGYTASGFGEMYLLSLQALYGYVSVFHIPRHDRTCSHQGVEVLILPTGYEG